MKRPNAKKRRAADDSRTTPARTAASDRVSRLVPVAVLLVAVVTSLAALQFARGVWSRLPSAQIRALTETHWDQAQEIFRRSLAGDAREGLGLTIAGSEIRRAVTGVASADEIAASFANIRVNPPRSKLFRLQQAAARMWNLEQADEPIDSWWGTLRPYLDGLEDAEFPHHQRPLLSARARAYELIGVGPGSAYELAEQSVRHPHGIFLQYFNERLNELAAALRTVGDNTSAQVCDQIRLSLLRQFVLYPAPAGLRLLAADLLVNALDERGDAEIANNLRRWSAAYRAAVRAHPPDILAPDRAFAVAPVGAKRLTQWLFLTAWIGVAAIGAAVLTFALGWFWLRNMGQSGSSWAQRGIAFGVTACVVICGLLWFQLEPFDVRRDLKADFSAWAYWPRFVFFAITFAPALIALAAGLHKPRSAGQSSLATRCGRLAATCWLLLAVATIVSTVSTERAREHYEVETRAACENPIEYLLPESDRLLENLRRWQPE